MSSTNVCGWNHVCGWDISGLRDQVPRHWENQWKSERVNFVKYRSHHISWSRSRRKWRTGSLWLWEGNINDRGDGQVYPIWLRGQKVVAEKSSMLILNMERKKQGKWVEQMPWEVEVTFQLEILWKLWEIYWYWPITF